MEKLFELSFQDQTLNPQVGTFTDASQTTGTFTLEDGEYYLTNGDTKGFYTYKPIALQSGLVDDSKVIIEFDLKVVTASANTHTIIGTYTGVDGSGIPTGAKITLQYNAGDIELVLGGGTTETLIAAADVVVDQWYHFRIDCALTALLESTYKVKVDGALVATVTGATTDYELGIISVLGTDLHACDECGIKNITLVTETNLYVGRTALDQALQDVKGYVDAHCMDLTSTQTASGDKTFAGTTTTHDVMPATTDTYDLGSSTKEYNNAYIKALTVSGTAAGDILTHNASEFVQVSDLATVATSGSYNDLSNKPTLESLSTNSIPFHNAYPRCKYLGTSITDAQNEAIKNRTYDDLFIGDYWTINDVNWRIVAIDYYYNVGDTNFDKGNIIVMPDTVLYNAQMNTTGTTAGAYAGSLMRKQNLNSARTIAQNAFGSRLANHRIRLANSVDASGPSYWAWYDSDGVELPNEVQIYGIRAWGLASKGFDVATQKQQFPLLALAPQFVNIRQDYWLQDVSSASVSGAFAFVNNDGKADTTAASNSYGVRPSVTLSFI